MLIRMCLKYKIFISLQRKISVEENSFHKLWQMKMLCEKSETYNVAHGTDGVDTQKRIHYI